MRLHRPGSRKFAFDKGGAAAVEFALLGLFYLWMILGVLEVARYVAAQQDLMSAVHATGRYAIVHGASSSSPASATNLQQMVGSKLALLTAGSVTASASFSPDNNPGSTVTISANYNWTPLVPLLHLPSVTITAKSASTILN